MIPIQKTSFYSDQLLRTAASSTCKLSLRYAFVLTVIVYYK